jgi:predicted tellurium resistance membrane protein TerC
MLHWVAPTIITLGLVLGIGSAIGHHLYYHYLDETLVTDQFQQTWALRYGSIFAIVTRICFSASLSTSIVQLFWHTFRKHSKTTTIKTVDYLFDITRNPLGFFSWRTWAFSPVLVFFGFIAW